MVSPQQLVVSAASKEDTFEERVGKGLSYGLLFGSLYGLTSAYWGTSNLLPPSQAVRSWGTLVPYVAKNGAVCAGVGAGYYFGEGVMSNMTGETGAWLNGFAGGCTAGAVMTIGTTKLKVPGYLAVIGTSGAICAFVKKNYSS